MRIGQFQYCVDPSPIGQLFHINGKTQQVQNQVDNGRIRIL